MSNISDTHTVTQKPEPKVPSPIPSRKRRGVSFFIDICIVALMGSLLFWGATSQFYNQYNDATRYQCYAVAFWQGTPGLASLPSRQCAFLSASTSSTLAQKMQEQGFPSIFVNQVTSQSTARPFHLLPPEYPLLTLVPFSLALVVPQQWYQVAFALWMAVVAGIIFFLLKRYPSTPPAIGFSLSLVLGSLANGAGRFAPVT